MLTGRGLGGEGGFGSRLGIYAYIFDDNVKLMELSVSSILIIGKHCTRYTLSTCLLPFHSVNFMG